MTPLGRLWWVLIRFGFRLLYNELAWTYDWVSRIVSLGNWRTWQRSAIPHLNLSADAPVLELAYGTGDLQLDLLDKSHQVVGVDLSPHMGRIAQRKLQRHGLEPHLVRSSAMHLPFQRARFQAVVSTFPTEFIMHPNTLSEVHRVLKAGGRMVVVFNGILTSSGPIARLLEWLYRITGQRGPWPVNPELGFRDAGFEPQFIVETLSGSQAWIMVAQKPRQ